MSASEDDCQAILIGKNLSMKAIETVWHVMNQKFLGQIRTM